MSVLTLFKNCVLPPIKKFPDSLNFFTPGCLLLFVPKIFKHILSLLQENNEVRASVFEPNKPCEQLDNFKKSGGILDYRPRFKNGRIHQIKNKFKLIKAAGGIVENKENRYSCTISKLVSGKLSTKTTKIYGII